MTRKEQALGFAGGAAVLAVIAIAAVAWIHTPVTIAAADGSARVLAISSGQIYWADDHCRLWRHSLDEPPGHRSGEYVMTLGDCSAHNPVFSGGDMFRLTGGARVVRHSPSGDFGVVAERSLSKAFAVDGTVPYLGHCAFSESCQIVRAVAGSDELEVMQGTHILDLRQLAIDETRLFWLDLGKVVKHRGQPPPPPEVVQVPRLMVADKGPHAVESALVDDFPGERFFLTPRFVLWHSAGQVWRVDKGGGQPAKVLGTPALHAVAVDGVTVFLATDDGLWQVDDRTPPAPRRRFSSPIKGVALDAKYVYFAVTGGDAISRIAR